MLSDDTALAYRLLVARVYELAGLSRRLSDREATSLGTTTARWHVLSVVSEEPATVPAIARTQGQVRQAVQRVVDDLESAGQVDLRPNPAHRASPLVGLTKCGRALLDALWSTSAPRRREALAVAVVEEAEIEQASDVLPGASPGVAGPTVLRRGSRGEEVEFVTIMTFDSWDAVAAFAGPDHEVAVVPPAARELLSRFDDRSQHYETVVVA